MTRSKIWFIHSVWLNIGPSKRKLLFLQNVRGAETSVIALCSRISNCGIAVDYLSAEFKSCVNKTVILCKFPHLNTWKPGVLLCVRWIYELRKRAYYVSAEFTNSGNIRLNEITQKRKPYGNTCLSDAFPRSRNNGNLPYTRVSCNGYLNFRLRKFTFPSNNRWENGHGNASFHPVEGQVSCTKCTPRAVRFAQFPIEWFLSRSVNKKKKKNN